MDIEKLKAKLDDPAYAKQLNRKFLVGEKLVLERFVLETPFPRDTVSIFDAHNRLAQINRQLGTIEPHGE